MASKTGNQLPRFSQRKLWNLPILPFQYYQRLGRAVLKNESLIYPCWNFGFGLEKVNTPESWKISLSYACQHRYWLIAVLLCWSYGHLYCKNLNCWFYPAMRTTLAFHTGRKSLWILAELKLVNFVCFHILSGWTKYFETKPELNWNSSYRIVGKTIYKALLFSLKYLPAQLKLNVFQIFLNLGDFWNENLTL